MSVRSAEVDIHSSYGGVINSASWYLMDATSSLRSADGRILVEGIYEQVQRPNERGCFDCPVCSNTRVEGDGLSQS